jgi:hypothetical protein
MLRVVGKIHGWNPVLPIEEVEAKRWCPPWQA